MLSEDLHEEIHSVRRALELMNANMRYLLAMLHDSTDDLYDLSSVYGHVETMTYYTRGLLGDLKRISDSTSDFLDALKDKRELADTAYD